MPVREKPKADRSGDTAHDKHFIPDNHRRQNDECETTDRDRRAGGNATDDELQRRIEHRRQPEQEDQNADPHDALEARQLRA